MAIASSQVALTTAAALLVTAPNIERPYGTTSAVLVYCPSAMYLGGASTVTTGNGFLVPAGVSTTVDVLAGEKLYAILSTGTATAYVLQSGINV